jgi:archaellum biogenesis ATPase FlaH
MTSTHLEKVFFHSSLKNTDYINTVEPRFFDDATIRKTFPIVKEFFKKYQEAPSLQQTKEIVKLKGFDIEITEGQLETLWNLDLTQYEDDWLREHTECWIEFKNLDLSAMDLVTYLRTTEITVENIKSVVKKAKDIVVEKNNIDFGFTEGLDFFNPESHRQPTTNTFPSGYSFIDTVSGGGYSAGTLTVIAGMAKVGKSIWLTNLAASAVRLGNNVLVISLEMHERKYMRRIGSNMLRIPMRDYAKKAEDQEFMRRKINEMAITNFTVPGKLVVRQFPTSTLSAPDMGAYVKRLQEKMGIKFKIVVIDYINIMQNWRNPNTENTYMKIKQIAEDLRAEAMKNEWAIVTATQLKQSSFDSNDLNMSSIAESSGLVATVDLMFGIIQDPLMHQQRKYKLKCLANRDEGYKNASKSFDINYDYMLITEDNNPIIEGDQDLT